MDIVFGLIIKITSTKDRQKMKPVMGLEDLLIIKVYGILENSRILIFMERVNFIMMMAIFMKEISWITSVMVMEYIKSGRKISVMMQGNIKQVKVKNLKVFFKKIKEKVTEYWNCLMEKFTKACSRMMNLMEKEHISGQTVLIIKACGGKISLKVKARWVMAP
jgi:hypothetical protein